MLVPRGESEPWVQKDGLDTTTLGILLEMGQRSGDTQAAWDI